MLVCVTCFSIHTRGFPLTRWRRTSRGGSTTDVYIHSSVIHSQTVYNTKSTRAHTQREHISTTYSYHRLICKPLLFTHGSFTKSPRAHTHREWSKSVGVNPKRRRPVPPTYQLLPRGQADTVRAGVVQQQSYIAAPPSFIHTSAAYSQKVYLQRGHEHTRTVTWSESGFGILRGAPLDILFTPPTRVQTSPIHTRCFPSASVFTDGLYTKGTFTSPTHMQTSPYSHQVLAFGRRAHGRFMYEGDILESGVLCRCVCLWSVDIVTPGASLRQADAVRAGMVRQDDPRPAEADRKGRGVHEVRVSGLQIGLRVRVNPEDVHWGRWRRRWHLRQRCRCCRLRRRRALSTGGHSASWPLLD